jgi:phosphoglucosamine mutase
LNVSLEPGYDWKGNERLARETQAVEAELAGTGRVLIRASGTEPLLRIMVEAAEERQAQGCAQRLVQAVKAG